MGNPRLPALLLALALAAACATASGPTDEEVLASEPPAAVVERARGLAAEGETTRALGLLAAVSQKHAREDVAPRAIHEMARINLEAGSYDRASAHANDLIGRYPKSEAAPRARLLLARSETLAGRPERAVPQLKDLVKGAQGDAVAAEAQLRLAEAYAAMEKPQAALWWYHRASLAKGDPAGRDAALAAARTILETKLSKPQLEEAAYLYREEEVGRMASARLAALEEAARPKPAPAPETPEESEAAEQEGGEGEEAVAETPAPVATVPAGAAPEVHAGAIGVVLPLSGPQAAYGERILRALLLGARAFEDESAQTVDLVVEDSGGRPERAREAVARLAAEDGVLAILGPVLGAESKAAAERAQSLGVPLLALTPEPGIAEAGDHVFRNYFLADHQAEAVAEKAVRARGMRRFAVFHPRDAYGRSFAEAFWWAAGRFGGEIVADVEYDPQQSDFSKEIAQLMGPFHEGARGAKFDKSGLGDFRLFVDFDAVYIPEDSSRIGLIASQFAYNELRGVLLLGNSGWNDEKLFSAGADALGPCLFVDSFFHEDQRAESRRFAEAYRARYGADPKGIDAEAYDGVGLLARAAAEGGSGGRAGVRAALAGMQGYAGASGTLRVDERREVRRDARFLTASAGRIADAESEASAPPEPDLLAPGAAAPARSLER